MTFIILEAISICINYPRNLPVKIEIHLQSVYISASWRAVKQPTTLKLGIPVRRCHYASF